MNVQTYCEDQPDTTDNTGKMGEGNVDKCPKGKYKVQCKDSQTKCETCPHGTYIDEESSMTQCFPCKKCPISDHLMIEEDCTADKNSRCTCMPGYYCTQQSNSICIHCSPASKCPIGIGVAKNHTSMTDTKCNPCPKGTYSDVEDYWSPCKNHTSCDGFGQYLKNPGTKTSNAECGQHETSTTPSWLLPAGLWIGFVITALVVFLALFIILRRNKRQLKRTKISEISFSPVSPVLPPDILKYPAECDVEKCVACDKCLTLLGENYPDMDSSIQCDGVIPLKTVSEKYSPSAATNEFTDCFTHHSIYQSEPQESEWNY